MTRSFSLKQKVGVIIHDLPRFLWAMRPSGLLGGDASPWIYFRNRNERLIREEGKKGVLCDWQWTSSLHAARVFPILGVWLMKRVLQEWPIAFKDLPVGGSDYQGPVELSFIIGHRGTARLPHLLTTLRSLFGQSQVGCEYLVVEQDAETKIKDHLPPGVKHIWIKPPVPDMPYSRSWAFNVGARAAKGRLLVLHDNDICVPAHYARELLKLFSQGYQAMRLQRFIFYLDPPSTEAITRAHRIPETLGLHSVLQNGQGPTIAVDREAYFQLGGHDEAFVGWGGEDNEFFQRCQTLSFYPYMYLPLVHLYHEPQQGKGNHRGRETAALLRARSALPIAQRVAELAARNFGNPQQLDPPYPSKVVLENLA